MKPHFDHLLVGLAAGFASMDLSQIYPRFLGTRPMFAPESFKLPAFEKIVRCVCECAGEDETWVFECLADMNLVSISAMAFETKLKCTVREKAETQKFIMESVSRHFDVEDELPFGSCALRGRRLFEWGTRGLDLGDRIMSEQGDFLTRACEALVRRHTELQSGGEEGLGLTFVYRDPYYIKPAQGKVVA